MENIQESFIEAPEFVSRCFSLTFGHGKQDKLVKPEFSFAHARSCDLHVGDAKTGTDSEDVPMSDVPHCTAPASLDATNPRDYLGWYSS